MCLFRWLNVHGRPQCYHDNRVFIPIQTSLVSVEGLSKLVDPSQLTDDLEGSLEYDHDEWVELRVSLEDFMTNAVHLLSRLDHLQVGGASGGAGGGAKPT